MIESEVLIIGGGIGGLALAAGLRRRGVPCAVLERAHTFGAVGAGITLQANATACLRALGVALPPSDLHPIGRLQVRTAAGRVLLDSVPPDTPDPSHTVHRADLHTALIRACGDLPLVQGAEVVALARAGAEVVVHSPTGPLARGRVVVGADGINSAVRRSLRGTQDAPLRSARQTCWRFAVHAPHLPDDLSVEQWGTHHRLGLVPLSRGRHYVFLVAPAAPGRPAPGPATLADLAARFAGAHPHLDALLAHAPSDTPVHQGDLVDRPRADFGEGEILLIGDAAHPMTPNLGQGAATALEDAVWLTLNLPEALAGGHLSGLAARLRAARAPRVEAVTRLAWRLGQAAHWHHPLARALRDLLLRATPRAASQRQMRALWRPGQRLAAALEARLHAPRALPRPAPTLEVQA